jgi:hypothetical protein
VDDGGLSSMRAPDAAALRQPFAGDPADFLLVDPRYQLNARDVTLESG